MNGLRTRSSVLATYALMLLVVACTAETRTGTLPPPNDLSQIKLTPASVGFTFTPGGPDPAPQAVNLDGTLGTVTGLSIGTILYNPISSGWLAADLGASPGISPNTVVLTPLPPADLAPGTYVATVPVVSSVQGVFTQYVVATITVDSIPAISSSPNLVVIAAPQGGPDPAAQFVSITNGGGGTLGGLSVGALSYGAGATGWLSATLNQTTAPATLTLQAATTPLAVGTYVAQVPINSTIPGVVSDTITVSVGVNARAQPPSLALSPTTLQVNAVQGGANPAPQAVSVSNGGGGTLAGLAVGSISYGPGANGWLSATINQATAPAIVSVQPVVGTLLAGTYSATVRVTSTQTGVAASSFRVNLTITANNSGARINLAPTQASFAATVGTGNPTPISVSVTNGGTGTLNLLSLGGVTYGPGAAGWLAAGLSNTSAPATITLTPTLGALSVGSYTARLPVNSGIIGVAPETLSVTFDVAGIPIPPAIGLSPTTLSATAVAGGGNPSAKTVTITNAGSGVLTGLGTGTITYSAGASGWLTPSLNQSTAPATLTLQPITGALAAGTYTATVPVTSAVASNSPRTVQVTFIVSAPASMVLTPNTVTFAGTIGQPNPTPATVNITSAGGSLGGLAVGAVTYGAGQPTGWLAATRSSASTPSTLVLTPNLGTLVAGTYTATVPVSTTTPGVASQSVAVTLSLAAASGSMVILSGNSQSGLVGSTLPGQLKVRVYDQAGLPKAGVTTVWQVNNGGTLLNLSAVSNAQGEVSATWKVGPLAGTHTVVVSSAGLPPVTFTADVLLPQNPGSHPNEPAGFVAFAEHNFSVLPGTQLSTVGALLGKWNAQLSGNLSIVTPDLTAPESQPNVLQTKFPAGFVAGRGPGNLGGWDAGGSTNAQKSKMYISVWVKFADSVFEAAPAVTKLGFIGYGQAPSTGFNQGFFFIPNSITPLIAKSFKLAFEQQNHVSRNLYQNMTNQALMTCGVWHQWEAVLEVNTVGQANGIFNMWIDGIQIMRYTDITYLTTGNTNKFFQYTWNPTWGGLNATKTRTDYVDIDHVYISGIP